MEPGELSRAVRDRAQSDPGRETEEAMAGRDVAGPCVDGRIAVQRSLAARLQVEDLRANLECLDVRRPDRAKVAGDALEPRAILRRVKRLRGSRPSALGGGSGYEEHESGERETASRQHENPGWRMPTAGHQRLLLLGQRA